MIDTNELRGIIAKNGKTQTDIAKMLNITPKTFYMRMKKGIFGSDEIQIMIDELHIEKPMEIFFCQKSNLIGYNAVTEDGARNEMSKKSHKQPVHNA